MNRRHFLRASAASPALAISTGRSSSVASTDGRIMPPDGDFMARLPGLLALSSTPGLSMGVLERGRMIWRSHHGVTDLRTRTPADSRTIWKAASLSKQVTAYAALRLVDAGGLELDRPLADYLGGDAPGDALARRITTRHVLTHSSGLPNWRRTADLAPEFEPGTRFQYSGEGYFLLARCMERIVGAAFEAHMQQTAFAMLGASSSTYLWRPDLATRLATGYRWGNTPWTDLPWIEDLHAKLIANGLPPAKWTLDRIVQTLTPVSGPLRDTPPLPGEVYDPNPAMSLMTNAVDYLACVSRFVTARDDGQDLSPRLRALAALPQVRVNQAVAWGLGWGVEMIDGQTYLFQQGAMAGACTTFVMLHPPSETGIVVFTNHQNGPRVTERIVRAATGRDHPLFVWA